MIERLYVVNRIAIRAVVCACALGGVSLTNAQTPNLPAQSAPYSAFEWMQRQTSGNTTHVGMEIGGTKSPASPVNGSGWQRAGNYGANTQINPSGITFGAALEIPHGGQKINANWRGFATKSAVGDAFGILFRNGMKLSGPIGIAAMIVDMSGILDQAGIKANTDPVTKDQKPFTYQKDDPQCSSNDQAWNEPGAWCQSAGQGPGGKTRILSSNGQCIYVVDCNSGYTSGQYYAALNSVVKKDVPANWDEARPEFEKMSPLPSEVSQKMIDWARKHDGQNGIEPFKILISPTGVTGPSSFPPTTKETRETFTRKGADGRDETVERTTRTTTDTGVSYDGDKVKVTPKETTTKTDKVTDADGQVRTETDTTTKEETESDKPKEEETDLCEKYPDILACAKPDLDTPEGEIPKEDRTITYQAEDLFGGGGCPADVYTSLGTLGQTVKIWDWAKTCQYALPLRAIVMSLAAFAAFLIVMPGETRT